MDFIIWEIDRLLQFLKILKDNYTDRLHTCPAGGLNRNFEDGRPKYQHAVPKGTYSSGQHKYKKKSLEEDSPLLQQLMLKEYLRVVLRRLDHNIRCLQKARDSFLPLDFKTIRTLMRNTYATLPDRLLLSGFQADDRLPGGDPFLKQRRWAGLPFRQSDYRPEEKIHITSRGLAVRTRAELLIAEMLYRYDIPFRYEQVVIAGKYVLAPDFTFLGADGEEFFWEYCGMMADPSYRRRQLWRRGVYEGIGINEWTNMIYTYDEGDSIDMREIEAIIKTKILPRMQGQIPQ